MITIDITDTQIKYLQEIKKYKEENDFYPSIRGLGELLNLSSPATIYACLNRLRTKGYLKKCDRSIYVMTNKAKDLLEIIEKVKDWETKV